MIETVDAELVELKAKKKINRDMSWADKRRFVGALEWHAQIKGYRSGWVSHAYKDYMGVWNNDPRVKDVGPIKPEGEIKNLLTYMLIKKAKEYQATKRGNV